MVKIAIIDDDRVSLMATKTLLGKAIPHCQVPTLNPAKLESREEFIKQINALAQEKPDLILTDNTMPYLSGEYVIDFLINSLNFKGKIALLSASIEKPEFLNNFPQVHYIEKEQDISSKIKEVLR